MSSDKKRSWSAGRAALIAVGVLFLLFLGNLAFQDGVTPKVTRVLEIQQLLSASDGATREALLDEYADILNSLTDEQRFELAQESHRAYIARLNSFFKLPKEEQEVHLDKIIDAKQLSAQQARKLKSNQFRKTLPNDDSGDEFSRANIPAIEYSTADRELHLRYRRTVLEREVARSTLASK